jgi:hypothetical protein
VKRSLIFICALLLFSGCALLPRKAVEITWPEKIDYMEAMCELDLAWKDMNYAGSMSLTLEYPEKLLFQVYGPFGDTIVYLRKDGASFLLMAGGERFSDEAAFETRFDMSLKDFMDDIALRGPGGKGVVRGTSVKRDKYEVLYNLGGRENNICWKGNDGSICLKFLEARFSKE